VREGGALATGPSGPLARRGRSRVTGLWRALGPRWGPPVKCLHVRLTSAALCAFVTLARCRSAGSRGRRRRGGAGAPVPGPRWRCGFPKLGCLFYTAQRPLTSYVSSPETCNVTSTLVVTTHRAREHAGTCPDTGGGATVCSLALRSPAAGAAPVRRYTAARTRPRCTPPGAAGANPPTRHEYRQL
jgi:hypothetical protein